ncbi:MAG: hypothetical protein HY822_21010 [Acidobacteria bacterium]|nr:hypothetical protein [Acidobacteriota bacterium]
MPGEDEIGSLSRSFNAMAEHVQASSRELEAKVCELERARRRQGELLKEVESANRELNEFAYVVSHDLKAPLRGIAALASWISEDYAGRLDEAGREPLRLILSRTHRMHDLIDGVLQYSRVGRVRESREAVDLGQLVPGVVDLLALPPHIRVSVESPLPTVVAEKTRIAQVFQNLLGNAAQYSDKEAGEIRIGCSDQGGFWRLSVADNGPGIPEKHFERIFQIFQTLDARDQRGGAGVGLAIVKKVIEIHGGRAWVESQVGCGSTFFFTLPKADGPLSPETCQEPSKCLIT